MTLTPSDMRNVVIKLSFKETNGNFIVATETMRRPNDIIYINLNESE